MNDLRLTSCRFGDLSDYDIFMLGSAVHEWLGHTSRVLPVGHLDIPVAGAHISDRTRRLQGLVGISMDPDQWVADSAHTSRQELTEHEFGLLVAQWRSEIAISSTVRTVDGGDEDDHHVPFEEHGGLPILLEELVAAYERRYGEQANQERREPVFFSELPDDVL
jgi:hypothetical protein